jgi:hypothetical protein
MNSRVFRISCTFAPPPCDQQPSSLLAQCYAYFTQGIGKSRSRGEFGFCLFFFGVADPLIASHRRIFQNETWTLMRRTLIWKQNLKIALQSRGIASLKSINLATLRIFFGTNLTNRQVFSSIKELIINELTLTWTVVQIT